MVKSLSEENGKKFLPRIFTILSAHPKTTQDALARILQVKKQNIRYYIKPALAEGLIERVKAGRTYELSLTDKGKEQHGKNFYPNSIRYGRLFTHKRIDNHQVMVELFNLNMEKLERVARKVPFGTTFQYYIDKEKTPCGYTLKFTTGKEANKLIIYSHVEELKDSDYNRGLFNVSLFRGLLATFRWLEKQGLCHIKEETIKDNFQEITNTTNEVFDSQTSKHSTGRIVLDRKAQGFFSEMDQKAEIRWDKSPPKNTFEVETNDLSYEEKIALLPETVDKLGRLIPQAITNQAVVADALLDLVRKFQQSVDLQNQSQEALIEALHGRSGGDH